MSVSRFILAVSVCFITYGPDIKLRQMLHGTSKSVETYGAPISYQAWSLLGLNESHIGNQWQQSSSWRRFVDT